MSSTAEEHEVLALSQLLQADGLPGVFGTLLRLWLAFADKALSHLMTAQADVTKPIYVPHGELYASCAEKMGLPR